MYKEHLVAECVTSILFSISHGVISAVNETQQVLLLSPKLLNQILNFLR